MGCIPLIASSIMSKKLAAGSDVIVLDVKTGSGAFMKTPEDAKRLAELMVRIGNRAGRRTEALITNMDIPLGHAVGNALEVREATEVLNGRGPADLREVCLTLASRMIALSGVVPEKESRAAAERALTDGSALERLAAMVRTQHGDAEMIYHPERLTIAPYSRPVPAGAAGYIRHMDTEGIGIASMLLGAGRARKEDALDYGAGIILKKKTGDYVEAGEEIAMLYTSDVSRFADASERFLASIEISAEAPAPEPLIYAHVTETD